MNTGEHNAAIDMARQNRYVDGNEETVTANIPSWSSDCQRAAYDTGFFQVFRRSKTFLHVVEGTPYVGGLWNLRRLSKDNNFLKAAALISGSDHFGSPLNAIPWNSQDGSVHYLTPTTLRYANNACNAIKFFGKQIFNIEVYEIGGGYGGECKVFKDVSMSCANTDVRWNIYDLPSSTALITKWLANFGYTATFLDVDRDTEISPNSLVLSCGALSEMRGELLKAYVDKIVLNARYGYFITNFDTHSKPFGGWSTEEFIKYLRLNGKLDVQELDAASYLSYFDLEAGSRLITFGADNISSKSCPLGDRVAYRVISKIRGLERRIVDRWMSTGF